MNEAKKEMFLSRYEGQSIDQLLALESNYSIETTTGLTKRVKWSQHRNVRTNV